MERIKNLNCYQRGILLLMAVAVMVFGVVYYVVTSRVGFLYQDHILVQVQENGKTRYTGKIDGKEAVFTVTKDHCLFFRYGEKTYGPYTVTEDSSAVPRNEPYADQMTGLVVRNGEEVLFRGGCIPTGFDGSDFLLYTEEGWYPGMTVTATMSDGTVVDSEGNVVDPVEPGLWTVLQLLSGPELTSKGLWIAWFGGIFLSILNAVSILFADELYRWNLAFRVRDVNSVEPSDWELLSRDISWAGMTILILVVYVMGLQ